MKVHCPNCNQVTELSFNVSWKQFSCPQCYSLYQKNADGGMEKVRELPKPGVAAMLYIGQQGVLDGQRWEVGSYAVKYVVNEPYYWCEYNLYNAKGEVCFLSEYQGNWTLAKEISSDLDINTSDRLDYEGEEYRLFNDSEYQTSFAAGLFDYPIAFRGRAKDYIQPPKAIFLEKEENEPKTFAFSARYVSKKEMQEAFPGTTLPYVSEMGMLQPFSVNLIQFGYIIGAVGLVMVLFQLFFASVHPSYRVAGDYVTLPDTIPEVTYVSPSFQYTGVTGPLQIDLSAPVNNAWAAVDFTLVNEETGGERFGSIEIAYYYGVDSGESWSEGTSSPSIKICSVPPGKYHLVMQISKQPNTPAINSLKYTVIAQASTSWNLFVGLGVLLLAFLGSLLWRANFEQQRWMLSDFAPETE